MRGIVHDTELPSRYGGDPRIMPAAGKKGNQNEGERSEPRREDSTKCSAAPKPKTAKGRFGPNGDLTKGSVSRFLVTLFEKELARETEGSACAVRTTAKPLATRSLQPKQAQTTVSGLGDD